jgi:predicted transcriptional regulator
MENLENSISYNLGDSEYRFACIVWRSEPVSSGELVRMCAEELGWKKSTTYTVLKNLIAKGILQNENSVVTSRVKQEQVRMHESCSVVEKSFDGSLPKFVAAFLGGQSVTAEEAAEIRALLDQYAKEEV